MNKTLIVVASSRKDGSTSKVANYLKNLLSCEIIDLLDYRIDHYKYEEQLSDDFHSLITNIISDYQRIIFTTPVYWYSMSGILKVFFDRLTDLLDEKDSSLKNALVGKEMGVITSSYGKNLGEQFWLPFSETASYLGMKFIGGVHTHAEQDSSELLENYVSQLTNNYKCRMTDHPNIYSSALEIIKNRGYRLFLWPMGEEDDSRETYYALKDGYNLDADDPLRLLGMISIFENFGGDWYTKPLMKYSKFTELLEKRAYPDSVKDYEEMSEEEFRGFVEDCQHFFKLHLFPNISISDDISRNELFDIINSLAN